MPNQNANPLSQAIGRVATPLSGEARDFDAFLEIVGDARFVLLGEATHGTHEFYRTRAEITKRLIEEKGFTAVAVEADWPDAYRVNRYVQGFDDGETVDALAGFKRFPQWMWRNADVLAFVDWLRAYNDGLLTPGARQAPPFRAGKDSAVGERFEAALPPNRVSVAARYIGARWRWEHRHRTPRSRTATRGRPSSSAAADRAAPGVTSGWTRP